MAAVVPLRCEDSTMHPFQTIPVESPVPAPACPLVHQIVLMKARHEPERGEPSGSISANSQGFFHTEDASAEGFWPPVMPLLARICTSHKYFMAFLNEY